MDGPPVQLVLLPGLGADERLFEPQAAAFPGLVVPPWIPPRRGESLVAYAARLAETVEVRRPLVLGGTSLGGMIACEMASRLKPDALVLVGSCRSTASLPQWHRLLGWAVRCLPAATLAPAQWLAAPFLWATGRFSPSQRRLLVDMFRQADRSFMRWALEAIVRWQASPLPELPVYQIHGGRDRIIPAARVRADRWAPDGAHLINLTHADAVNAWLGEVIAAVHKT